MAKNVTTRSRAVVQAEIDKLEEELEALGKPEVGDKITVALEVKETDDSETPVFVEDATGKLAAWLSLKDFDRLK